MKVHLDDRFWSKVNKTEGCWIWTSTRNRVGRYGHYTISGKKYLAHRLAWFDAGRTIPEGMVLDHICHRPDCVKVDHLQLVTQALNTQNLKAAYKSSKTGVRGVSWSDKRGGYVAQGQINGKKHWLGLHSTLEAAEAAVTRWRREHMPNILMDKSPATERGFSLPRDGRPDTIRRLR